MEFNFPCKGEWGFKEIFSVKRKEVTERLKQ